MTQITQFGDANGLRVQKAVLKNDEVSVSILSLGAITQDWRVRGTPVVLGLNSLEDYLNHSKSFGIIAGRVANRTAKGKFELDGQPYQLAINNGAHHLHGGPKGLGHVNWTMEPGENAVRLTYHSPDGEMGYPGAVDFEVIVTLSGHDLIYDMTGTPDRVTPINLAQHNYYNLDGQGDVRDHRLWVDATSYTEVDADLIPTGQQRPLQGSTVDFRESTSIASRDPDRSGFDVNVALRTDRNTAEPAAILRGDQSKLELRLWTDEPGIQLFNAPSMEIPVPGLDQQTYGNFAGVCLEAQHFPDALNQPQFQSILCAPLQPYRQKLRLNIN